MGAVPRRVTVDLTVLRESRDLRLVVIGEALSELGPLVAASLVEGAAADRVDRKRVLLLAQAVVAAVAGTLALITALGRPSVGAVFVLAGALAGASAVDNVTRA